MSFPPHVARSKELPARPRPMLTFAYRSRSTAQAGSERERTKCGMASFISFRSRAPSQRRFNEANKTQEVVTPHPAVSQSYLFGYSGLMHPSPSHPASKSGGTFFSSARQSWCHPSMPMELPIDTVFRSKYLCVTGRSRTRAVSRHAQPAAAAREPTVIPGGAVGTTRPRRPHSPLYY